MKKVYIYIAAMCLAALTGCIKEEISTLSYVDLDVNVTRANYSSQQGDQIEEIMIWAFEKNASGGVDSDKIAAGWRRVYNLQNTYTSTSLHLQLPMCGSGGAQYRLIAIVNPAKFGETIDFNGSTKYGQLTSATFTAPDDLMSATEETNPGSPAVMPVSHWTDITVAEGNTHENTDNTSGWQHFSVNMPVFRAVAKTQFFVTRKGDFDITINNLELRSGYIPNNGVVLSESAPTTLEAEAPALDWFSSTAPTYGSAVSYNVLSVPTGGVTGLVDEANNKNTTYTRIGSRIIYESANVATSVENYDEPTDKDGYYYYIKYTIGEDSFEKYVAIPNAVVRNHDYQIKATVEAGGKLSLSLVVKEWVEDSYSWSYTDVVECTQELAWNEGTNIQEAENDTNVQEVILPKSDNIESQTATCSFTISAPVDAAYWMASFVRGDIDAFKFVTSEGEVSTVKGKIGEAATLTIRTTNHQVDDTKKAYLDIVVVTNDGRTLSANSAVMENNSYRIVQELTKQNN